LEPENSTERAPDNNPLDPAVRNFAHHEAAASGTTCKAEDPQEEKTTEKRSRKDRASLFNTTVIPLDSAGRVFASAAADTPFQPDQWSTQPASLTNEPGQIRAT
jgi:hypothetical protein